MSQESLNQTHISEIKDQFVMEWFSDKRPQLNEYISQYPQYAEDLTMFVLTFIESQAFELREEEIGKEDILAMERGLLAGATKARTIAERLRELNVEEKTFERSVHASMNLFAAIHRRHVQAFPARFVRLLARSLQLPESAGRKMLAPKLLAYRAKAVHNPQPVSFEELITELRGMDQLSESDYEYWKNEVANSES